MPPVKMLEPSKSRATRPELLKLRVTQLGPVSPPAPSTAKLNANQSRRAMKALARST
jgi:hypothetical protein